MHQTTASGFTQVRTTDLPVFRLDHAQYSAFYAPGFSRPGHLPRRPARIDPGNAPAPDPGPISAALVRHARHALDVRATTMISSFEPVCMILYLGNRCNLRCTYCYASSSRNGDAPLDWPAIRPAAQQVLANCERRGAPMTVVFHGGGEPTLYPDLITRVLDELEPHGRQARRADLPLPRDERCPARRAGAQPRPAL